MMHRLAELLHKFQGVFSFSGWRGRPDDLGGAGVRSPLKPRPVLVGTDAKPIPEPESGPFDFAFSEERFRRPR